VGVIATRSRIVVGQSRIRGRASNSRLALMMSTSGRLASPD
jgi:hypothetical protein